MQRDSILSRRLALLASCCLFMLSGPGLVLLNRQILKETSFKYPMCVSGMGVLCTSVFFYILVDLMQVTEIRERRRDPTFFVKNCLPVGACQVLLADVACFTLLAKKPH